MKVKDKLARWFIIRVLNRAWDGAPEAERAETMSFLQGYKEKLTGIVGAACLLLSTFGLGEFIPPLKAIGDAVEGGNWGAAVSALVGAILILMRTFNRMKEDRNGVTKSTGGGLQPSNGPTVVG
jgi:hypothetical protein